MKSTKRQTDSLTKRRKARERTRHRREILDAAERVFAVRGYRAATMEEIARQSEFSVGSLYNFFANKDTLYEELMNSIGEAFLAEMAQRVLRLDSPMEALRALVELRLDFLDRHRGFFRMVLEESAGARWRVARSMPRRSMTFFDRYLKELIAVFQRGIRSGVFDREPPLYQALAFDGMVNALMLYSATREDTDLSREAAGAAVVNRFRAREGRAGGQAAARRKR